MGVDEMASCCPNSFISIHCVCMRDIHTRIGSMSEGKAQRMSVSMCMHVCMLSAKEMELENTHTHSQTAIASS